MNGELERSGKEWKVRFSRPLAHDTEKVWLAVSGLGHLAMWFPQRVIGEWSVGSPLLFADPEGDGPAFDGEVLAYEPPRALEFRWGIDIIRIELTPTDGGCTLILTDTIDEVGTAARTAAGWHVCLDRLELHLDEAAPPWTTMDRWREVHPGYVDRFGPEAARFGPPEGWA
jgi:uncharacterized protein YndB with AHSA1/START domain